MPDPLPVIPLTYGNLPHDAVTRRPVLPTVSVAACFVATALIQLVDVETIIVSGPVIALLGLILLVQGWKFIEKLRAILGGLHLAICALLLVFANYWQWGPAKATIPFFVLGLIHTSVVGGVVVHMWRRFSGHGRPG